MRRIIFVLLAALTLMGSVLAENNYTQIDQETAMEMMIQDDGRVIVDVRTKEEYDAGHIPGAILIPSDNEEAHEAWPRMRR